MTPIRAGTEPRRAGLRRAVTAALAILGAGLVPAGAQAAAPALIGAVSNSGNLSGATSVAVSGHYAYTTAYWAGQLTAVDISDPAAPMVTGSSAASAAVDGASTVAVSGGYAFVASKNRNASSASGDDGSGNSLSVFDVHTHPAQPILVGSVHDSITLFGAYGVAVQGGYAYVSAQGCLRGQPCENPAAGNDLDVISLADPAGPQIVQTITDPASGPYADALDHADSVAISGSYAYITASYNHTLAVVDISSPAAAHLVASLTDTRMASADDVAVSGRYAYVLSQSSPAGGFTVVDVADPTAPRIVSSLRSDLLQSAYRVRVRGNHAYVATDISDSIAVVDIRDPANPQVVASIPSANRLNHTTGLDLDASGRYVVATSPFLVSETSTAFPPYPLQGGPTNTGTVSIIDLDPRAVGVSVSSPAHGGRYLAGQTVRAAYTCSPQGIFAVVACTGPVSPGAALDTRAPGRHTFTVTGVDEDGRTGSSTVTYTVLARPTVSHLRQKARRWREPRRGATGQLRVGTVFAFSLNLPARVTLRFDRLLAGRRQGRRCAAPGAANRTGTRCTRVVFAGRLVRRRIRAGRARLAFAGKLGRRWLAAGTYRVTVIAMANGVSARRTLTFTIVG